MASIFEILGPVTQAKYLIEGLKESIVNEMRQGFRPTSRGVEWSKETLDALDEASRHIEASFHLLKACQWPSTLQDRREEVAKLSADPMLSDTA